MKSVIIVVVISCVLPTVLPAKYIPKWKKQVRFFEYVMPVLGLD